MCLAIPMQITALDTATAQCSAKGVTRTVGRLLCADELDIGDFVLVHLGHIVARVTADEAAAAWELYDQLLAAQLSPALPHSPPQ